MVKRMIDKWFGAYVLDKAGISKSNVIANSYMPNWDDAEEGNDKVTSTSKWHNFFYRLYNL